MMMKPSIESTNKTMLVSRKIAALLLISILYGCALTGAEPLDSAAVSTDQTSAEQDTQNNEATAVEGKSEDLTQAEMKVKALEEQLASMKVEWEQQKPALERLVSNEADLEFLVQALADMSQLADEPSRTHYLGQDELTPEKREQSLQALQSLVTSQEELNTLLVELSTVVSGVASNNQTAGQNNSLQNSTVSQATDIQQNTDFQSGQSSDAQVVDLSESSSTQPTSMTSDSSSAQNTNMINSQSTHIPSDCNCNNQDAASTVNSGPAKARDTSWYAMTTPYLEATPADSKAQLSQLDSGAAAGQPIPGVQVKTFKRRTLPSELAAAGADMQEYALAPKFHMSRKSLSDYVSQLAFKLAGNQQLVGNKIGVASFVFFDEQLEQTSAVGNQLAEELSTVLPHYGAQVIEYKLTREITVSPTGDFSLSRNTRKLRDSQGMDYVLTGTMVPTRRGLQINSRVVSTRNNVVIASATTLIPALVLQQL